MLLGTLGLVVNARSHERFLDLLDALGGDVEPRSLLCSKAFLTRNYHPATSLCEQPCMHARG